MIAGSVPIGPAAMNKSTDGTMVLPEGESENTVILQEVGPRDGLQNEPRILTPAARGDLINRLSNTGLKRIQIGSFVNPRLVPQMAGIDEVWRRVQARPGIRYSALVLSRNGVRRATEAGIPHVEIYVSASDTHSRKNVGSSAAEALKSALHMIQEALDSGMGVTAGVMCAFGCFYEGAVSEDHVKKIVDAFNCVAPVEIGLADTAGLADPDSMKQVIRTVGGVVNVQRLTVHLHDTRGLGMANLAAALECGVRRFDTSILGLGGCPFIPGAAGNISTERTATTLERMGFRTGIDVNALLRVAEYAQRLLFDPKIDRV
jgi:hydroxymethylglutaryl-CoA lyase